MDAKQQKPSDQIPSTNTRPPFVSFEKREVLFRISFILQDIISMTANAFPEDWTRCAEAGMCTYLPKPVKRDTMLLELRKAYPNPLELICILSFTSPRALVRSGNHFCPRCCSTSFLEDILEEDEENEEYTDIEEEGIEA